MFLDSLSLSLLQICNAEHLSYERASERCNCSSKHFANIVCKRSYPSLHIFEQICLGFHETPDHLLGVTANEFSFRAPMPVMEIRAFPSIPGTPAFPVCPHCGCTLEREHMAYCDRCGQHLSWSRFKGAAIVVWRQP